MLPHFVQSDWEDVVDDLNRAGYGFRSDWFAPTSNFVFHPSAPSPRAVFTWSCATRSNPGTFWAKKLPAEERPGRGLLRRAATSESNGDGRLPLCRAVQWPACAVAPHRQRGGFVAGVRYRAWQPTSCLHPDIPVHSPLVFDIVDTWSGHAVGGCTYHVVHPGGRANEQFPVNAYEAESRRLARFSSFGHTPGAMNVPAERPNIEFPLTLDLRRKP